MTRKPYLHHKHSVASQIIPKRSRRRFPVAILVAFCLALAGHAGAQTTDTTPLQLKSFSFSPNAIDTSNGPQTVLVNIGLAIDNSSDLNMGAVELEDPRGNIWGWGFYPSHRISGDSRNGVYQVSVTFPRNSPQGTWRVSRVVARVGTQENFTVFTTSMIAALGFPTTLQVSSSPPPSSNADLRVSIVDSPDPVALSSGQNINYSIFVTNAGPSLATGVVLVDILPSSVTFVSADATGGICSYSDGVVACYLGSVAASATVSITAKPTTTGSLTNIASVQGNEEDPNTDNNTAIAVTTVGETSTPAIITEETTDRAIALNAATFVRDPFTVITERNFGTDKRTRVMLFATNTELLPGENASAITAQIENPQLGVRPLTVEYAGKVPGFNWLTQINVILPGELANAGDAWVSIRLRGVTSNKARINIK